MKRPTRATAAGQAYLDLQNRARAEGRATQELLTLYVVERWLARLSMSPYADQFIIKGGMLLAAYDARRPTADLDALAQAVSNDQSAVVELVIQIAIRLPPTMMGSSIERARSAPASSGTKPSIQVCAHRNGLRHRHGGGEVPARCQLRRPGHARTKTSQFAFAAAGNAACPSARLSHRDRTCRKITTAIGLGPANTRVRDYADIYTLTRNWPVDHGIAREALLATAAFRGTTLAALSSTVDNLADLRQQTKAAYRANLGTAGEDLPASFSEVV